MAQLSNFMRWVFLVVACCCIAHGVLGDDNCTLKCSGHGNCTNATAIFNDQPTVDEYGKPFDFLNETDVNGQSCVCDEGWTDVVCSTKVDKCQNSNHACYFGGVCVDGIEEGTNEVVHVCDCRNAFDNNSISYLGAFCQKPSPVDHPDGADAVPDSVVCDEVTMRFCINGGTCVDSFIEGEDSCNCPYEYTGYHCEFHKSQLDQGNLNICSTDCQNGGSCQIGYRNATDAEIFLYNPDFDPNVPTRFEYCQCPDGYAGGSCELKFSSCGNVEDLFCAFGTCETVPIVASGNVENVCVCQVNQEQSYAGLGCGTPASSYCTWSPGVNGRQFCTNNGTCTSIGDGIYNCTCTGGYHGPHCEFPDSVEAPESFKTCSLICQNGGSCAEGLKDYGMLTHIADIDHLINDTFSNSLEHCVCATGYTGDLCEHVVQVCGDNQHVCFHGSECVDDGGDDKCDCDTSQDSTGISTAGEYCQYTATVECDAESGVFCVNNGVCRDGGCDCPEPFRGPRCEFKMQIADIDGVNNGDLPKDYMSKANANVIIITGVMAALAIMAIVAIVYMTGAQTERYDDGINVPPISAFPPLPSTANIAPVSVNESLAESAVSSKYPHAVIEGAAQGVVQDVKNVEEDVERNEII